MGGSLKAIVADVAGVLNDGGLRNCIWVGLIPLYSLNEGPILGRAARGFSHSGQAHIVFLDVLLDGQKVVLGNHLQVALEFR